MVRRKDDALVIELAAGKSVEDAAAAAGLSRASAFRRLSEDGFQQRVNQARAEFIQQVAGQLAAGAKEATEALLKLLQSANERVRFAAAKSVLEQAVKAHDMTVLEARVAELEKLVRQKRNRP